MSETAQQTHLAAAGASPLAERPCGTCGSLFKPKRAWATFCSTKCRNDHHAEERRKEGMREAAPDLYVALELLLAELAKGAAYAGSPSGCVEKARTALVKAGYKEPKPEKAKA